MNLSLAEAIVVMDRLERTVLYGFFAVMSIVTMRRLDGRRDDLLTATLVYFAIQTVYAVYVMVHGGTEGPVALGMRVLSTISGLALVYEVTKSIERWLTGRWGRIRARTGDPR